MATKKCPEPMKTDLYIIRHQPLRSSVPILAIRLFFISKKMLGTTKDTIEIVLCDSADSFFVYAIIFKEQWSPEDSCERNNSSTWRSYSVWVIEHPTFPVL